jgi:hypothetical protein
MEANPKGAFRKEKEERLGRRSNTGPRRDALAPFCFAADALPHGELVLQTKLQTNSAAQNGIGQHKPAPLA